MGLTNVDLLLRIRTPHRNLAGAFACGYECIISMDALRFFSFKFCSICWLMGLSNFGIYSLPRHACAVTCGYQKPDTGLTACACYIYA